jgi:hypothetical protein
LYGHKTHPALRDVKNSSIGIQMNYQLGQWEQEPPINLHTHPVISSYENQVLTVRGEAQDIAAKKLCMVLALAVLNFN